MKTLAYSLFETAIGPCGIAWNAGSAGPAAISFFQLPEATPEKTQSRIARCTGTLLPSAAPPAVAAVVERAILHLRGAVEDFRDVLLDLEGVPLFARRVYEVIRGVAAGKTTTYGEIATLLGDPAAARAVGQALGRNPIPLIIPCHRVLAVGGKPGGFTAYDSRSAKARLLAIEGASVARPLPFPETDS